MDRARKAVLTVDKINQLNTAARCDPVWATTTPLPSSLAPCQASCWARRATTPCGLVRRWWRSLIEHSDARTRPCWESSALKHATEPDRDMVHVVPAQEFDMQAEPAEDARKAI